MVDESLYECVPNFSEGRNDEVIDALRCATEVAGVRCLGLHSDRDHHRSVMTLVGSQEALLEAVYRAVVVALDRIDLTAHRGVHPRIGAVDVIPFIPLQGGTMGNAIAMAHELGERVARELSLPVFYYEQAARMLSRRNLADVRRGQFEGLAERLMVDAPDVGPQRPHPTAGAVAIGARPPLIAFNVYLDSTDVAVARAVAQRVRESSGGLSAIKALGLDTVHKGSVQVSINLVDYRVTSLYAVLEQVKAEAASFGVKVKDTELVGLAPFAAIEDVVRECLLLPGFRLNDILEMAILERGDR